MGELLPRSEQKVVAVRNRSRRDGRWLRRVRARYIAKKRRWIEEDKSRIEIVARTLLRCGAFAGDPHSSAHRRRVRYSILRAYAKADQRDPTDHFWWYRWTELNGWQTYTWLPKQVIANVA